MSLLERIQDRIDKDEKITVNQKSHYLVTEVRKEPFLELKVNIHQKILEKLGTETISESEWDEIRLLIDSLIQEENEEITRNERKKIIDGIIAEMKGFGPIDSLLNDDTISEVMVNHAQQVFIERNGKLEKTSVHFRDDSHVMRIIEKIVAPIGRRIDESSPMVDARLPDGSRVNAIIPPLAIKGPSITIRKFAKDPYDINDLIKFGTLTRSMADFLEACVKARLNMIVSGGTGSGKTTTLNVLSSFISEGERIVTIEDAAELQLNQEHLITLETRPANIEGKGAITMRDLMKNSLRMRPDRIVVGEVRSGEALDMLQAMNTGHDGSLTTGHANTPRDMLSRLETMVLMAGMDLPIRAIREQIASAINVVIQQNRLKDGTRRITRITEILGMEGEVITMQDIFIYKDGRFVPTGVVPSCYEQIKSVGIPISTELFQFN